MEDFTETMSYTLSDLEDTDFQKRIPILTFIGGGQVGRRVLLADDSITLGRSPDATIMIADQAVSRLHVGITYDAQNRAYVVNDLGSSNGTLLNGKTVQSSILHEGDKVMMGHTVLRFSWIDAVDMVFHGEVDKLINIDDLTGLVVKRRFDEEFHRHVAVALKNASALAMLMMDMDGLKNINDTMGHPFGSFAISETAKVIQSVVSSKGLASRFGGDEFMAFLPSATRDEAKEMAEDIRRRVVLHDYVKDNKRFRVTISIGLAELNEHDTPESLLNRADKALYISKQSGRNRVSVIRSK